MTMRLCNYFKVQLPFSGSSIVLKGWHLYQALISFAFILSFGVQVAKHYNLSNIGAVFEVTSLGGKGEKTAMEIAVQKFNISLFMYPGRDPLIAAITAEKPDKEMNMWEEGTSIAAIGNHNLASVLSYAAARESSALGQPFLAKWTINDFKQRKCFAATIPVYSRSKVIPISEEEAHVIFIIKPSYSDRVSSILTVQQLEPVIADIERLKKANSEIGSVVSDSFLRTYFEGMLGFKRHNIENDSSKYKYEGKFVSMSGAAAFLELPDGKVFLGQHRKHFIFITSTAANSFRGFSFAFKKGSPVATDVSRDILNLYEHGTLKSLEENRFAYSSKYLNYLRSESTNFWGIYLIFGATSTVCLLLFLIDLIRRYCCDQDENEDNRPPC